MSSDMKNHSTDDRFMFRNRRKDQKKRPTFSKGGGGPSVLVYVKDNGPRGGGASVKQGPMLFPPVPPMPHLFPFDPLTSSLYYMAPFLPPLPPMHLPASLARGQNNSSVPPPGTGPAMQQPQQPQIQQQQMQPQMQQQQPSQRQQQQQVDPSNTTFSMDQMSQALPYNSDTCPPGTYNTSPQNYVNYGAYIQYPPSPPPDSPPRSAEQQTYSYNPPTPVSPQTDPGKQYSSYSYSQQQQQSSPYLYHNYATQCACDECLGLDRSQEQGEDGVSSSSSDSGYNDAKEVEEVQSTMKANKETPLVYCDKANPTFTLDAASLSHYIGMAGDLERYGQHFQEEKKAIRKKIPCRNLCQSGACHFGDACWFSHNIYM